MALCQHENSDSAGRAPALQSKRSASTCALTRSSGSVESILFGELDCVARNVSAGGIFVEMSEPLPLGAHVRVSFLSADNSAEIVALGEVKNHYFMNFAREGLTHSVSGMAVRFYSFENESQQILADCLDRFRVLN